ncbi:Ig-like domain-containing protein [Nakamurella alba]|uniref:Ig-like domain-containing protein n=1 Tax=Nakamurella alba TaxID=2665158 RepID=UPI0018A8FA0D|nr:Ig-like domain-containing protein [Nakamurella alba]
MRPTATRPIRVLAAVGAALLVATAVPTSAAAAPAPTAAAAAPQAPAPQAPTDDVLGSGVPITSNQLTITPYYCDPKKPTQTWTVPDGVHSVYIEAVGGQGQTPNPDQTGIGGLGGQVTGGMNVTPGQVFQVQVGCHGTSEGGASAYAKGGAKGEGWSDLNDFGTIYSLGIDGGGGGGASAVSLEGDVLVVAAGGGGAAGSAPDCITSRGHEDHSFPYFIFCGGRPIEQGGNGGDGTSGTGDGSSQGTSGVNNPGGPTSGGEDCNAGRNGHDGKDFRVEGGGGAGGGGGGGYLGGCGGDAGIENAPDDPKQDRTKGSAGNGGGGGQSYAASSLNDATITAADDAGDGYVLFLTSAAGVVTQGFPYRSDHRTQTYCVPDGVDEIFVDALGAAGGGGGHDLPNTGVGGSGSGVQAVVKVTERTQLAIVVGEYGGPHGGFGDGSGGARGDAGSDDFVFDGAGGGGSTAVKQSTSDCSPGGPPGTVDDPGSLGSTSDLVVAAGGGGAGGEGNGNHGGDGGDGGNPAQEGDPGGDPDGGDSGCAGESPGNGCHSDKSGHAGSDGGGDGGAGGGGGGGLNGGGGGHGTHSADLGGGGGGGGGRSYVHDSPESVHYYHGPKGDLANADGRNNGKVDLIVPIASHRSQVQIVSGNNQTALPGATFAEPLVVRYVDAIDGVQPGKSLTVTVNGSTGATFADGSTSAQLTTDSSGEASISVLSGTEREAGQFTVTAAFADDPAHLIRTSEFTLLDSQYPTAVTVTSDTTASTSADGQAVTFTATATSPQRGNAPLVGASVQFAVDGIDVGDPVPTDVTGSVVSDPITTLLPGPHRITATVTPATLQQSTGTTSMTQVVTDQVVTELVLTSEDPAAIEGDQVSFTATVAARPAASPAGVVPVTAPVTGSVQFAVAGVPLGGPVPVTGNGTATSAPTVLTMPPGAVGGRQPIEVTATYAGTAAYVASQGTYTQYLRWQTTLDISSSEPYGTCCGTVTFQATIEGTWWAELYPAHTGTVQFFDGDQPLTTPIPLQEKAVTSPPVPVGTLGTGVSDITARYSGDTNYGAATSEVLHQIVIDVGGTDPGLGDPPPPTGPELAATGTPATDGTALGLVLLLTGGLALAIARRRTRSD